MAGIGSGVTRAGHHGHKRYHHHLHHQRLLPITTLMLMMICVTVFTNLYLASWILPPLFDAQQVMGRRRSVVVSDTDDASNNDGIIPVDRSEKILHIVTTRFQQLQPALVELGKARLELFETFCLPTMIQQDVQDGFLWFVMTDPDLDPILMERLERLLAPYPHFYLVASNQKLVTPTQLVALNNTTEFIRTGDLDRLYGELLDIHRPLLIETRLDADDGLNGRTLSEIQRMVLEGGMSPADTRGWQIICSRIHYEWRNNDITAGPMMDRNDDNSTAATSPPQQPSMSSGKIRLVRERICVTPGYTLVRHRPKYSIDFPVWPRTGKYFVLHVLWLT